MANKIVKCPNCNRDIEIIHDKRVRTSEVLSAEWMTIPTDRAFQIVKPGEVVRCMECGSVLDIKND